MKPDTFPRENSSSGTRAIEPDCTKCNMGADVGSAFSDKHCGRLNTDQCVIVKLENENRFRSIIETVGGVIFVLGTDFCILEWNRTIEKLSGWTREEVIGKNYLEYFVPKPQQQSLKRNIERVLNGVVSENIEFPFKTKNGEEKSICFNITSFEDRGTKQTKIIVNGLDVTERKESEDALKQAKDELENLVTAVSSSAGLDEILNICLDAAIRVGGMDCGGIYIFEENTGSLVLVKHKGLSKEFVNDAKRYDASSLSAKLVLKGEAVYQDYQDLPVDMNKIRADENLKAIAVIPIKFKNKIIAGINVSSHTKEFIPETARRALESIASEIGMAIARSSAIDALVESERKYRALIEATDTGYVIFDEEGRITDANMEYVWFTGNDSIDSVKGKMISEWIDPSEWKRFEDVLKDVVQGKVLKNYELTHTGINEKTTTVDFSAKGVKTEEGVRIISLCRDISFHKGMEKVLMNNERRLRILSQRLISNDEEERSRLSRELHDELGQQLSALLLEINLLKQVPEITNEHLDNLQLMIKNTTTELRRIYKGLNPVILERMDFKFALISLVEEYSSQSEINVKYSIEDISPDEINPDVSLCIYRVLQESLTNIIRHAKAKNASVKFYRKDCDFVLSVRDDGIGFEIGDEICDAGIGLTGLRERVISCKGNFRVESFPGHGTRIMITIPEFGSLDI